MKIFETYGKLADQVSSKFVWVPLLIARLCVGYMFAETGWGKLHKLPDIVDFFTTLKIPHPELMAPFVSTVEFVGGSLLILGLLTRFAAVPLIVTMVVAIVTAKAADFEAWTDAFGNSEYLTALILFVLIFTGAGCASADAVLFKIFNGPRGPQRLK